MFLSRLPLQESHKCNRLQKKLRKLERRFGFVLPFIGGVVTLLS